MEGTCYLKPLETRVVKELENDLPKWVEKFFFLSKKINLSQ